MVMNKKNRVSLLLISSLLSWIPSNAQLKYWVLFKNKNGTPYTTSNPAGFLSQKAIDRRAMYSIAVDATDLPVTPSYVTQIDNLTDVTVLYASKWLNGVVVSIPPASLNAAMNAINAFSFVASSGQVKRYAFNLPKVIPPPATELQNLRSTNTLSYNMGGSFTQNKQVNVDCLHNSGYRGQGMTIAVMDIGFDKYDVNPVFDSVRNRGGFLGTRDFVSGGVSVTGKGSHGSYVLSCMAAVQPGVIMGSAPRADYWLIRTEEGAAETISEEYNWVRGAEFADSVGADILTTSLGYTTFDNASQNHNYNTLNGKTAPMSIAATIAARKGLFVLNAAGNEGNSSWMYVGVPADADSICSVGAVDGDGKYASFSSKGPTADGRIKPDLVARGLGAWVAETDGSSCFPANGTSFATPILAGAVACYWQKHRNVNNMLLLKTLRISASNFNSPNNTIGWGIPNVCSFVLGLNNKSADLAFDELMVYPNPFNSLISIYLNNSNEKIVSVSLNDMLGKTLQTFDANSNDFTLDLSNCDSGIYFLRIETDSKVLSKKIIKQ